MTLLESLILGIVQGATEFLPVSSSGHLVIGQYLLGLRLPGVTFEVAVHVGTLLSIVLVYRTRIRDLVRGVVTREGDALRFVALVALATVPAGLVGVFLGDLVEGLFDDPRVTGVALLVTGTFLWSTRAAAARGLDRDPTIWVAVAVGIAQALAITPGISRSGATVTMALWLGMRPERAAEFAFLMAIPAIAGAGVLELRHLGEGSSIGAAPILLGSLAAAVTGVLAIRLFLVLLEREAFHRFAVYCWAVGLLFLAILSVNG